MIEFESKSRRKIEFQPNLWHNMIEYQTIKHWCKIEFQPNFWHNMINLKPKHWFKIVFQPNTGISDRIST